jgi:hypothetical protein
VHVKRWRTAALPIRGERNKNLSISRLNQKLSFAAIACGFNFRNIFGLPVIAVPGYPMMQQISVE